eukprot:evm.model.scf_161.6 EVM.evm.TU.scf_161.6   scf_161:59336-65983(+)
MGHSLAKINVFAQDRLREAFLALNVACAAAFGTELSLKILAHGAPQYFGNAWDVLDSAAAVCAVCHLVTPRRHTWWRHVVLTSRAIIPLRAINRVPEMRAIVSTLANVLPGLGGCLLVSVVFWVIFAILGTTLFMGTFYSCNDPEVERRDQCVGLMENGEPREWSNARNHFDNFFHSFMTLMEISTMEGWVEIMLRAMDASGIDRQPKMNAHPAKALFFIAFICIGAVFLVNLFVGLTMDNYAVMRHDQRNQLFVTENQRRWVEVRRQLLRIRLVVTAKDHIGFRAKVFSFVTGRYFEMAALSLILLNLVVLATDGYYTSPAHGRFLDSANTVFTALFAVEAALKVYAWGPLNYLADAWNAFDAVLVVFSILSTALEILGGVTFLRALRVARGIRLVRRLRSLRVLFNTLLVSLPALLNVGGLAFVIIFFYAVIGMCSFRHVYAGQRYLNRHANFQDMGTSMLTLFRMLTGEGWNGIMHDTMVQPPLCCAKGSDTCPRSDMTPGDCGSRLAPLFFLSFSIIGNFILLNLFLAVVLDIYGQEMDGVSLLTDDDILGFRHLWQEFDPEATGFLRATDLVALLRELPRPLGIREPGRSVSQGAAIKFMKKLGIRLTYVATECMVFYQDVLQCLLCRLYGVSSASIPEAARTEITRKIDDLRSSSARQQIRALRQELHARRKRGDRSVTHSAGADLASPSHTRAHQSQVPALHSGGEANQCARTLRHSSHWKNCRSSASSRVSSASGSTVHSAAALAGNSSAGREAEQGRVPRELAERLKRSLQMANRRATADRPAYTAEYGVIAQMLQAQSRSILFRRRLSELYLLEAAEGALGEALDAAADILAVMDTVLGVQDRWDYSGESLRRSDTDVGGGGGECAAICSSRSWA